MKYIKNSGWRTFGLTTLVPIRPATGLAMLLTMLALVTNAAPASATGANCVQDVFGKKALVCTANDVKVAKATRIRNLDGSPLTQCAAGDSLSFVADFTVVTTATARENIGLYFATAGQSSALTGTCSDNIIAPVHYSSNKNDVVQLGSNHYEEFDNGGALLPDNCGDTSSSDPNGGTQIVTVEVDNVVCTAGVGGLLALPDCTSWQQPGGTNLCQSSLPDYPYPAPPAAIPGAPSKCNCDSKFTIPVVVVQKPGLTVTKSADKTSLDDPGGTVTYTIDVTNNSNLGSVTINQICDSYYGQIAATTSPAQPPCSPAGTGTATPLSCALPAIIPLGSTFPCTFTASQGENSTVTDMATAYGLGQDGTTPVSAQSNSVTVTVSEAATTGTITKSLNSITSNCATVRYGVDVANTSSATADETLTLSALTDSQYGVKGDITNLGGGVLGTTCGVATTSPGLGTLSGSSGAGAFGTPSATIAPNGHYTCQFDAQFCGAPGPITGTPCANGISNTDTVSATLTGDEGETVSLTPGTLTVVQCITTSAQ